MLNGASKYGNPSLTEKIWLAACEEETYRADRADWRGGPRALYEREGDRSASTGCKEAPGDQVWSLPVAAYTCMLQTYAEEARKENVALRTEASKDMDSPRTRGYAEGACQSTPVLPDTHWGRVLIRSLFCAPCCRCRHVRRRRCRGLETGIPHDRVLSRSTAPRRCACVCAPGVSGVHASAGHAARARPRCALFQRCRVRVLAQLAHSRPRRPGWAGARPACSARAARSTEQARRDRAVHRGPCAVGRHARHHERGHRRALCAARARQARAQRLARFPAANARDQHAAFAVLGREARLCMLAPRQMAETASSGREQQAPLHSQA